MNPVDALTSGKIKKGDVGKTVYLSNSGIECQEWRIADINHDSTSYTVDLFPKYTLNSTYIQFSNSTQYYANSSLRAYLNGDVLFRFSKEIIGSMKIQNFPSNGTTLSDKVKCPSLMEMGLKYTTYMIEEGTIYPIFGTSYFGQDVNGVNKGPNYLSIYKKPNGGDAYYWTRSRSTDVNYVNATHVWNVDDSGYCHGDGYGRNNTCAIACIRFAKDPILEELSKPNPVGILTSGKITKDYIGFPVTLTNSSVACKEWVIADVNHDNRNGTVDLISRYALENSTSTREFDSSSQWYGESSLRKWLASTVYNGFDSKVRSVMKAVENDEWVTDDKVKCPSLKEMGIDTSTVSNSSNTGSIYPIFGAASYPNILSGYSTPDGKDAVYWTSSRVISGSTDNRVWFINNLGVCNYTTCTTKFNVIAIIRF